ncbi:hypothetical protein CCAX7_52390 [Capsulimonas corticalis]|uniref:Uncharacterized protein n=1 Tax=Capsulimonas corticalis TaxID=2219043 RepID=A0A402CNY7_9BACT|nr:hypothetical protein [Capsulimonas corticalis]BDI33188.1 hypothetical protein CCAX7_52390 [Capsulimonas corticalis]
MKSLKLACYASLIIAISGSAHAKPVHKRPVHTAHPAPVSGIGHLLQGYYNQANAAAARKDLDGAFRYFSQDFVLTNRKGNEVDLGEIRFRVSALFDSARSIKPSTLVTGASQHGSVATALIRDSIECIVTNPDTGKKGLLVGHSVSRDTWTHTEDGWMITSSQQISTQETINGRVVTDPDPAAPDASDGATPPQSLGGITNGNDGG